MSRRKQAKPRAVLKHGSEEDVQQDANFTESKDAVTDVDSEEEEQQQHLDDENDTVNHQDSSNNLEDMKDPTDKPHYNDDPNDEILGSLLPSDAFEMTNDAIEDDNSSDTFYSDLYSTHTSSSYSPSMSEEAGTPNSLVHHHHHHHPSEEVRNRLIKGRRRNSITGANGSGDGNDDDDDDVADSGEDERVDTTEDGIDELSNMGDSKIPMKMRKIDRDCIKSEKMTGDGIKTASDGSYQCQFCDKSFPRLGYLKKHEQSHAEHLPFKCEYCARLFKHKRSRDRHTKLHTGDRRYRCPHCEAAFSRSDHLKIHMKTHDNQKPFQCTVCNRGYNTAAALTSHMQNHKKQAALLGGGHGLNFSPRSTGSGSSNGSFHKRRYATAENSPSRSDYRKQLRSSFISCIYCTKSDFASFEQLNSHIKSMHENVASKDSTQTVNNHSVFQLSCEYCTMKFPNIPAMFQHMRATHIDRLASPNSYFEHFNRLAASGTFSPRLANNTRYEDVKVKTEETSPKAERPTETEKEEEQVGPTDLSQPKKRSQTPSSNSSSSEKPSTFLCNQCNAGLPDFDTFRAHLKTHITQGVPNFVCHHCNFNLRDQAEFERHVISHFLISSSEYACAAPCTKVFPKPDELQKHLFEHHVQAMFKCSLCSDLFDSKVAIQVHFACAHSNENKIFRCSACIESFRSEKDFTAHVKTRHTSSGSIQCMFCRTVCSSELEMHFHLAAHARQFRCPSCPETFHVEFLLDRHMQTHHAQKDGGSVAVPTATNSVYHNQFNKQQPNNNNNVLDYHSFAANKGIFPLPGNKFYSPLQVDTSSLNKHPALMYGLGQRYFDTNKTLLDMYNYHQEKSSSNYFISPSGFENNRPIKLQGDAGKPGDRSHSGGFSCGMCERSDFRTEAEVHSHRKIVHNLKTGVSLRCAYCSGNFKSRSELEHHMKTCHNSTGKHKCLICDEIFPSPAILAEHKLQHSKVGQSGKCSHCSAALSDVAAFKSHLSEHNVEGQIPVQCICCRQTLNSDFEIGLHAKFHTKSSSTPESLCALCLEAIPSTSETRVCEKCCRKHNLSAKFNLRFESSRSFVENRCNLCKMILPHAQRLQEHLIEHTFVGCEERGYSCYICSAVFTVPAGLLSHMHEHGPNARPYDCNLCSEKYFFRAELDNHLIEHESLGKGEVKSEESSEQPQQQQQHQQHQPIAQKSHGTAASEESTDQSGKNISNENVLVVKTEANENVKDEDEEEYIEVEKIPDISVNEEDHDKEN